jgi:hypothetical protein
MKSTPSTETDSTTKKPDSPKKEVRDCGRNLRAIEERYFDQATPE